MSTQEYIDKADKYLLHTYNRFPVVFDRGEGVRLYDTDGKEYLDFAAGIAVYALGYSNKALKDAIKTQADKITHTSNLYYSMPTADAAEKLTEAAGMDRVFFTNSGAEAIEGAVKTARKYAFTKDGSTDHEIIAMENSFHGRTMGALSVTGNAHYREAFEPMIGNIRFARFNDLDSVKELMNDKSCAVIMETIQGEGGIYPPDPEFIRGVRKLCDESGALLILDEIQCGMGRSGKMFAFEHYGIRPDIVTVAKAVGGGVPVGAFLMTEEVARKSLVPGDHGSTYGGNPLATAAVSAVLDQYKELDILSCVNRITPYFEEKLDGLVKKYDFVKCRRGMGLMQGLVLDFGSKKPGDVAKAALENGLVVITAGADVLRFVPPLVITESDIDEMIDKLVKTFEG